jgi:predicted SnoaL-like aldol condensation-catalyzing enzyme
MRNDRAIVAASSLCASVTAMSSEQSLAVLAAFIDAYNAERIDDAAEMYAADAHLRHVTRDIDVRGREAIRTLMHETLARFPDRRSEEVRTIAKDDMVVTERRLQMTPAGADTPLVMEFCYVFRIQDGKIAEQVEYG